MLGGMAIILATVVAYIPAIRAGFIWDDDAYLTKNAVLAGPGALQRIWFEVGATPQYYPLVFTSFWGEQRFWGLQPIGYHLVNVLLHAASAILLWLILRRLAVPGAYFAAAVFALHPVQVESVAWITERKNVLSGVFALGSMLAYLRYRGIGRPTELVPPRLLVYAASLILFACGLLSKTVVCSLPVVLALVIWWKRGRLRRADARSLVPMLVIGLVMGLTTVWVEKHVVGAHGRLFEFSLLERSLLAGRAVWFYTGKLVWPATLVFSYPRWEIDARAAGQYLWPAAVIGVAATLWLLRSRLGKGPLVGYVSFLAVLFPALGFINVYPMRYAYVADHFQYHASIAMIALLAATLARTVDAVLTWLPRASGGTFGPGTAVRAVLAGALLVALGIKSWHQEKPYKDAETLWEHTLSLNPEAQVAHLNLAKIHQMRRDLPGFVAHLKEAIRLDPGDVRSYKAMGDVLVAMNRYDEALDYYQKTLQFTPEDGEVHHNLANILSSKGRIEEALRHYHESIRTRPFDPLPHYSLGLTLQDQGKPREAMDEFRAALKIQPQTYAVQRELAWMLATHPQEELRNTKEALSLAQSACEHIGYQDPLYLDTLAAALAQAGQFEQAVAREREALMRVSGTTDPALAAGIRHRLSLYEQSRPYVQPGTGSTP